MARIIEDELYACDDCTVAIANGDFTGMDHTTEASVRAGMVRLFQRGHAVIGEEYGYTSQHACDCCGKHLAGNRHEMILLFP